jgi:hypothetical protein
VGVPRRPEQDRRESDDVLEAARVAAVREAEEETGVTISPADLVHFAFWLPPPLAPKRFATWFFAARARDDSVVIDDGEIVHHEWMSPDEALRRCDRGEFELAPPTWVTLHTVARFDGVGEALEGLRTRPARHYVTHVGRGADGPVAMWTGDAGYDSRDPQIDGPRHRLEMTPGGYRFDESGYRDPS